MGGTRCVRPTSAENPNTVTLVYTTARREKKEGSRHPKGRHRFHLFFLHWSRGPLTFCKVSIKGGRARQRDVTLQAQRYREVTESTEEPPSLQPRIARTLTVASAEQLSCALRSPKWATKDEAPLKGRTLPAAPSKKPRVTETCMPGSVGGKIGDSFTLQSGECEHEVTLVPEATRLLHQTA